MHTIYRLKMKMLKMWRKASKRESVAAVICDRHRRKRGESEIIVKWLAKTR
jgi:hypothetical protein